MSFMEHLEDTMNVSATENGAVGLKTTKNKLVDFNFKVPSYRDASNKGKLILDFKEAWNEDPELAIKYLFYLRDIRGGLGERDSFRTIIHAIATLDTFDNRVFKWIMVYGRADDLFALFGTELEADMMNFVQQQLSDDAYNSLENKPISLLAKWMPSLGTKNDVYARKFIKAFGCSQKEYRKTLSKLRKYLKVVEQKICANEWGEINYEEVPSYANLKYKNAFLRHDEERRRKYLSLLEKGEAKINSATVFPHDIVGRYRTGLYWVGVKSLDKTLEAMWKALPDYVKENNNILVVRDGSGSMSCSIPNSNATALDVSTALAIYFSERQSGEFKDKFITFSSMPKFIDLSRLTTLHDKLKRCYEEDECSNTNIQRTMELVLNVAVVNKLKQEEIPTLLIISDMEFDSATYGCNKNTLFQTIAKEYAQYGYSLPKLVFWNVNSRTNTIPVNQNKNGVILVSGYSTAIVNMVLSNEIDPYQALVKILQSERYSQITLKQTIGD